MRSADDQWVGVPSSLPGLYGIEATTRRALSRHAHEDFTFALVTQGVQRTYLRGKTVEAGPGDLILLNPHELHDGSPRHATLRSWQTLYVDPALASLCLGLGMEQRLAVVAPLLRQPPQVAAFQAVFDALGEASRTRTRELLRFFLRGALHAVPRVPDAAAPDVVYAQSLIDASPTAPHSVESLAQACGLSRWHFVRAFGRHIGLPPHAYVVQKRIEVARALIRAGASLANAASLSGFSDQSHMTRIFRRKFGLSPRVWAAVVRGHSETH